MDGKCSSFKTFIWQYVKKKDMKREIVPDREREIEKETEIDTAIDIRNIQR